MTEHNFNLFTNKAGVFLTTQEIRNIKDVYGKNGLIPYRVFLEDVKYSITPKVSSLIGAAYDKFDPSNTNDVSLQTLISAYDVRKHPHVLARRKKPEDVKQ